MILQQVAAGGGRATSIFHARCSLAESVGDFVYIAGPPILGLYQVRKVDIDDVLKRTIWGIVIRMVGTECYVQTTGIVSGLFSNNLNAGSSVFVGTDSKVSESVPIRPITGTRLVQSVGIAVSNDEVHLNLKPVAVMVAD